MSLYTAGKHGELGDLLASDRGELQLTDYGISGIPVFQVSRYASEALDRKKRVLAVLDFFPSLKDEELFLLLKEQRMYLSDRKAEGFLNGIFHKKLAALFLKAAGIRGEEMTGRLSDKKLLAAAELIKRTVVEVCLLYTSGGHGQRDGPGAGSKGRKGPGLSLIHI